MEDYIYENLFYSDEAYDNGTQGIAIVHFVVETDGSLTQPGILRHPGDGLGEEALLIVQQMIDEDIRWVPGVQKGEKVRVLYNMVVKFRLD